MTGGSRQANRSIAQRRRDALARWIKYGLLICAIFAAIAPVYWMMTISLKTEVDQFAVPPRWLWA